MIEDTQRTRLFRAEHAIWPRDRELTSVEVDALVAEFDSVFSRTLRVLPLSGDGHVKLQGGVLWVPDWARRPLVVLHELTHSVVPSLFPAHGAEFAAKLLTVVRGLGDPSLAEALEIAFDREHVHHDTKIRQVRSRRVITNYANQHPGVPLEVVLDDPPELVVGAVGELLPGAVYVGNDLVDFSRLRYVNALGLR